MASDKPSLEGLRIDRSEVKEGTGRRGRLWIILFAVLLLGGAVAWWLTRPRPIAVRTVTAQVRSGDSATVGAVLNASGYVTARRQATVSSKITGKVVDVLVGGGGAARPNHPLPEEPLVASCNPGTPGGRIVVSMLGAPKTFNVMMATESATNDVISGAVWEGLLDFDNVNQEIQPGLLSFYDGNTTAAEGSLEAALKAALRLRPGYPKALVPLGVALGNLRRFAEAEFYTDTDAAIQQAPKVQFGAAKA